MQRFGGLRYSARGFALGLMISVGGACWAGPEDVHPMLPEYGNVLVTYACHAKSLWKDAQGGGFWGDGFNVKDQNGAVRGSSSTLLTYAMLVHALDGGWLKREDMKVLKAAGLTRDKMVEYIRLNLAYLAAKHKSRPDATGDKWGYNWQSSLWMQSIGMATLLVWNDLGDILKKDIAGVAAAEADWVASKPPKDMVGGDTGAEENAWNTGATAVALALAPEATSSTVWWKTLKTFAVNSYSHPGDKDTSSAVTALVSTRSVNPDWSLVNHNFFHPDYVQVTGMHLGEAWAILSLGDRVRGSHLAQEFEPYSLHNVGEMWRRVLRPLLLPTGEFAYPAGNDWTFHCSTNQGYFAYIATALNDFDAAQAEERALVHVQNRREIGPPGRLLGDSNLEWWWESLVCKRVCSAILFHELRPGVPKAPAPTALVDNMTTTGVFPDVNVWYRRTPDYFFSVSHGKTRLGYFVPFNPKAETVSYSTLPVKDGLLPEGEWEFKADEISVDGPASGSFWKKGVAVGGVLAMDRSVVVLSRDGFTPMKVENDTLTDPGVNVVSVAGTRFFPRMAKGEAVSIPGPWLCVGEELGLISPGGFSWKPGKGWAQRSVAFDKVAPTDRVTAWQMMAGSSEDTALVAKVMVEDKATSALQVTVQDGVDGKKYRARLDDGGFRFEQMN